MGIKVKTSFHRSHFYPQRAFKLELNGCFANFLSNKFVFEEQGEAGRHFGLFIVIISYYDKTVIVITYDNSLV